MLTKEVVDKMLEEAKETKARAEAAEAKVKEMEETTVKALTSGFVAGGRTSSIENRALSAFGVSHPKDLLSVDTSQEKYAGVPAELKHAVRQLKEAVDTGRKISQMFHGQPADKGTFGDKGENMASVAGITDTYYGKNVVAPLLKAFNTTDYATWLPQVISQVYIPEYELDLSLEDKFKAINMPSAKYTLPVVSGVTKARKAAEGATMTAANFSASNVELEAVKIGEHFLLPEELTEDAAPDVIALCKSELVQAHRRSVESAIINGDNDGSHPDSDSQAAAADVAEKLWKGLRALALANTGASVNFNGAATESLMIQMMGKMKKFGVNKRELMWVVGPGVSSALMALPGILTVDKAGPMAAAILNGQPAAILGLPIYTSQHMREDLNASGVYDGVTTSKASILLVNHRRFYVGVRRPLEVRLQMALPNQDQWMLASYQRKAFKGHAQSASEMSVVYGYNVSI